MDIEVLRKKISTFKVDGKKLRITEDSMYLEILQAWENWTGPGKEFYSTLNVSKSGMAAIIGKAKRMKRDGQLEGSDVKSWYLWGFSNEKHCFLECKNTRSGDVAIDLLNSSKCEVLVSDVFGSYNRTMVSINKLRAEKNEKTIFNAKCNAHARRYFFKVRLNYPQAEFYLENYHQIYLLNKEVKDKPPDEVLKIRDKMTSYFLAMKTRAEEELQSKKFVERGKYHTALNYFLENYNELIYFINFADVAIDNNAQERLLRSHVVGRKTWYGTHSERGAETAAILFSIVETCKLNKINPREYLKNLVEDLNNGKNPYTPSEYKDLAKV